MVDFRYHLVSLIAVFLALALGIVLGSGPLRTGIADSLAGDLSSVRAELDAVKAESAQLAEAVEERDNALGMLGAQVSDGTLKGRTILVVTLPGAVAEDVAAASAAITEAGGAVILASFTESWQAVDQAFLQGYAGQLAAYVAPAPGTRPEGVVAGALALALRDVGNPEAEVLLELVRGPEIAFVSLEGEVAPTDAALVVGPRVDPEPVEGAADRDPASMVGGIAGVLPTVTLGATTPEHTGVVDLVRAADMVTSTIDSVGEVPGFVAVPMALVAELSGAHGHYGSQAGASAPLPRLVR